MRAMGPGSVSSLLKTALDVVYWMLWGLLGLTLVGTLLMLALPGLESNVTAQIVQSGQAMPLPGVMLGGVMLAFMVSLGGFVMIVGLLRRIFDTLAAGDPFHPRNVRRLRLIGMLLAGVELFGYATRVAAAMMTAVQLEPGYGIRAVTTWFSVLVVFVLAEVFREGARLRRESELTI